MWIKLGILLTGFFYAGFLPHTLRKTLRHTEIDLNKWTISYLSNKRIYGRVYLRGYKWMMFAMAVSCLVFFRLLVEFYDLHARENLLNYADYTAIFLISLAFLPHNMQPISFRHLGRSLQRILHNIMALLVFITLPALIITFHIAILTELPVLAISGMVIVAAMVLITIWSVIANGLNGVSELIFINGISIWGIVVTVFTVLG